jgi:beta-phosphoglucomutase family hydrolase
VTVTLAGRAIDAVLFDLDGVLTQTADLHAQAWKQLFDSFFADHPGNGDRSPLRLPEDYLVHIDGKPRLEGIRSLLAARGIELADGADGDPPEVPTIHGLAARKNGFFHSILEEQGVDVFEGVFELLHALRTQGVEIACVSSSKNCRGILRRAGLDSMVDAVVDGNDLEDGGLTGKPAPDLFIEAARRVGVEPERSAVIEDALSGVEAGRSGGFGLTIGVDRGLGVEALMAHGAALVLGETRELLRELGDAPTSRPFNEG